MGHSQYDPAMESRVAWNAGQMVGAKRARKPRQIWAIRFFLDYEGRMRDRALSDLAIDSKLRGCDLVKLHHRIVASRFMSGSSFTIATIAFSNFPSSVPIVSSWFVSSPRV